MLTGFTEGNSFYNNALLYDKIIRVLVHVRVIINVGTTFSIF